MPQLLSANGRRSGGRHIESAVSAAARGANAKRRGSAGLVFANIEFRPTSLRHFLASSSLIAAARADGVIACESACCSEDALLFSACVAWMKNEAEQISLRALRSITAVDCSCASPAVLLVPYMPLAPAPNRSGDPLPAG